MLLAYLSYLVRQCFKAHNKNKSEFATNRKLCAFSLPSQLLFYKEDRLQSPNSHISLKRETESPVAAKKKGTRKPSVTSEVCTMKRTWEVQNACGWKVLLPCLQSCTHRLNQTALIVSEKGNRQNTVLLRSGISCLIPQPPSTLYSSPPGPSLLDT